MPKTGKKELQQENRRCELREAAPAIRGQVADPERQRAARWPGGRSPAVNAVLEGRVRCDDTIQNFHWHGKKASVMTVILFFLYVLTEHCS